MKRWALVLLCPILASCYARDGEPSLQTSSHDIVGRPIALAPSKAALSSPGVVTSRGIIAYQDDLEACRTFADRRLGSNGQTDDVQAVLRAVGDKPIQGSLSVKYDANDVAMKRDRVVKECMSRHGYLLKK